MHRSDFLREAGPMAAVATLLGASVLTATGAEKTESVGATDKDDRDKRLAEARALLKAHDRAFTNHDLDGVMATYGDGKNVVLMGTGPGEYWLGKTAIREAYQEMMKSFDKGSQKFEYKFRRGDIQEAMAWLATAGVVEAKKDGKPFDFVLNLSLVLEKGADGWKIASLHFSNLTGPASEEPKKTS